MNAKRIAPLAASAMLISGICAAYFNQASFIDAPDPDEVKAEIVSAFKADPAHFAFDEASKQLARSRVEGAYAVCSSTAEAMPDQYVELAQMIDKHGNTIPGLRLAMNAALLVDGVSDCDYRVLTTLVKAGHNGGGAEAKKSAPAAAEVATPANSQQQ